MLSDYIKNSNTESEKEELTLSMFDEVTDQEIDQLSEEIDVKLTSINELSAIHSDLNTIYKNIRLDGISQSDVMTIDSYLNDEIKLANDDHPIEMFSTNKSDIHLDYALDALGTIITTIFFAIVTAISYVLSLVWKLISFIFTTLLKTITLDFGTKGNDMSSSPVSLESSYGDILDKNPKTDVRLSDIDLSDILVKLKKISKTKMHNKNIDDLFEKEVYKLYTDALKISPKDLPNWRKLGSSKAYHNALNAHLDRFSKRVDDQIRGNKGVADLGIVSSESLFKYVNHINVFMEYSSDYVIRISDLISDLMEGYKLIVKRRSKEDLSEEADKIVQTLRMTSDTIFFFNNKPIMLSFLYMSRNMEGFYKSVRMGGGPNPASLLEYDSPTVTNKTDVLITPKRFWAIMISSDNGRSEIPKIQTVDDWQKTIELDSKVRTNALDLDTQVIRQEIPKSIDKKVIKKLKTTTGKKTTKSLETLANKIKAVDDELRGTSSASVNDVLDTVKYDGLSINEIMTRTEALSGKPVTYYKDSFEVLSKAYIDLTRVVKRYRDHQESLLNINAMIPAIIRDYHSLMSSIYRGN